MQKFDLQITNNEIKKDLTIIYKGPESDEQKIEKICEIKTSKDILTSKLHYFKQRTNEIYQSDEIYIHDEFPHDIFTEFIDSLITKHISINDKNYSTFYALSTKYQYSELQANIKSFIEKRPDLALIINDLSLQPEDEQDANYDQSDQLKEELISKNLDICLQNHNLRKLPIQTLNRIFNHPNRILKNHHLLFKFVIERMNNPSQSQNPKELEDIQILPTCLDYNEMSLIEIEQLIEKEKFFMPKNSDKLIKTVFSQSKECQRKNEQLEMKIEGLFEKFSELKQEIDNQKRKSDTYQQEMNKKLQNQFDVIQSLEKKNQEYEISFEQMRDKIQKLELSENEQKTKIKNLEEKNMKLQSEIDEQQKKVSENEPKFKSIFDYRKYANQEMSFNNTKVFPYEENREFKGIINYLQENRNISNEINITASSVYNNRKPENVVLFEQDKNFCSKNIQNSWLCFDFTSHFVIPTSYTFKKGNKYCYPTGWIIEGSNDSDTWDKIDEQIDPPFTDEIDCVTFYISNKFPKKFRFIRIKSTKPSSNNSYHLIIESFEIYGTFIE
ncbi:hypothetical protein M9Y10_005853 [Tritrichomonas musculus]|uniref:BTB domain-containing protein n=1 Tax=Tritrichomonas musculus TaxID=1915356 RepID=A0ABR2JCY5_9EUKA